jgi:hypothetical protein
MEGNISPLYKEARKHPGVTYKIHNCIYKYGIAYVEWKGVFYAITGAGEFVDPLMRDKAMKEVVHIPSDVCPKKISWLHKVFGYFK